jgi:hypothetical protein
MNSSIDESLCYLAKLFQLSGLYNTGKNVKMIMNGKYARIQKEAVVSYLTVLSQNSAGGHHKKLGKPVTARPILEPDVARTILSSGI